MAARKAGAQQEKCAPALPPALRPPAQTTVDPTARADDYLFKGPSSPQKPLAARPFYIYIHISYIYAQILSEIYEKKAHKEQEAAAAGGGGSGGGGGTLNVSVKQADKKKQCC